MCDAQKRMMRSRLRTHVALKDDGEQNSKHIPASRAAHSSKKSWLSVVLTESWKPLFVRMDRNVTGRLLETFSGRKETKGLLRKARAKTTVTLLMLVAEDLHSITPDCEST